MIANLVISGIIGITLWIFIKGIRIVRPTHRALIETFGDYKRFGKPGFNWVLPIIQQLYQVNITEQMIDAKKQEIITDDNLNASVDAQVYFKVKEDEASVQLSQYKVNNVKLQIVQLARTTLRDIIGNMTLKDANSKRNKINKILLEELTGQTKGWGVEIVRTELKEIEPPRDVQETMNKVVKAENEKLAAEDYATATETEADGERRAAIKVAEGKAKAIKLEAGAKAEAIIVVNNATEKTFTEKAQLLRKLETVERSLMNNAKIVIPSDKELINVIGDIGGILPTRKRKVKK